MSRRPQHHNTVTLVGNKEFRRVQKAALAAGWCPIRKKKGIMWRSPDGQTQIMIHMSSSDHHALDNIRAEFRAAGLTV